MAAQACSPGPRGWGLPDTLPEDRRVVGSPAFLAARKTAVEAAVEAAVAGACQEVQSLDRERPARYILGSSHRTSACAAADRVLPDPGLCCLARTAHTLGCNRAVGSHLGCRIRGKPVVDSVEPELLSASRFQAGSR